MNQSPEYTNLDEYINVIEVVPLQKLEDLGQGCQKYIIFNILDKKITTQDVYIEQCRTVLKEYRRRFIDQFVVDQGIQDDSLVNKIRDIDNN